MKHTAAISLVLAATAAGVVTLTPGRTSAQEPIVVEPPPSAAMSPAELLAAADAAVDAGNLVAAAALYDRIAREHATSPEAGEARRALKIIAANQSQPPVPGAQQPPPADGTVGVVIRREPYSLRTSERLRLTTWEKLDFGTTAFLYGMSVGFSFALSSDNNLSVAPVAIGALAYTVGAVAYLQAGDPDRGDLPLTLAITSFIPTTALLVANIAGDNPNAHDTALLTAGAGLLSVPIAILAARKLDLDPGDTQLVRDAGFWGMVLGTTGMLAFGGKTVDSGFGFTSYQGPSDRKVFTMTLIGLCGGLGLGAVAAANSEVSLERVRVATWGGYGGAVIGLLLGASVSDNDEKGLWTGLTIGAATGLFITFLATSGLDGIPPEDAPTAVRARRRPPRFTPTLMPIADAGGRARPALGVAGIMF